jgi:hypothetical protein
MLRPDPHADWSRQFREAPLSRTASAFSHLVPGTPKADIDRLRKPRGVDFHFFMRIDVLASVILTRMTEPPQGTRACHAGL